MRDFKLLSFDMSNLPTLYQLWKDILCKDSKWHFFWEGSYTALRVEFNSVERVIKFLTENKVKFIDQGPWVDNIHTTRKYQKEFMSIFHSFSELAMKNIDSDIGQIDDLIDRVIHCFMNNLMTNDRVKDGGPLWEPLTIAKNAVFRSTMIGQIMWGSTNDDK